MAALAQFARHDATPAEAPKFVAAAKEIADGYRSLDSLCNGASMRFWESFWGIGWSNCLNMQHGWSSWTGALHYELYLATKDTHHLCAQPSVLVFSPQAFLKGHFALLLLTGTSSSRM